MQAGSNSVLQTSRPPSAHELEPPDLIHADRLCLQFFCLVRTHKGRGVVVFLADSDGISRETDGSGWTAGSIDSGTDSQFK